MDTNPPYPSNRPAAAGVSLKRSPREFVAMFLERWWIGALLGAAAGAAVFHFSPRPDPVYRTEVSLLFESKRNRILAMQEIVDTTLQGINELNNHLEQLRSKTFLEYLLTSFTADEVTKIQQAYRDPLRPNTAPPALADIIQGGTAVNARRGTTIISITVNNRNPESAALIANRYARKYIDFSLDRANTGTSSAIIFLRNQAEETRAEVEAAENSLQSYRARNNMATLGEAKDVTVQKLASLGEASVAARLIQIQNKSLIDKIAADQAQGRDLSEISQIASAPQVAAAKSRLTELGTTSIMLEQRYLARHPKLIQNEVEMKEARRLLDDGVAKAVSALRTNYDVADQHLQSLQKEMVETEAQVRQLDKIAVDYKFLEQDAATKRATYTGIVGRLGEAKITSQLENTTIKVFDAAQVPSAPLDRGTARILGLSVSTAFGLLLVVPLLIGLLDTRIRSPLHVEQALGEKLLGAIKPLVRTSQFSAANSFRSNQDAGLVESWRGIYSEIELGSALKYPKAILVSSSIPAEGKTQVSCNLAAVFAQHRRRVLLVDCDLRRPGLHRQFDVSDRHGWTEWIQQPADTRPAIPPTVTTIEPHFDFLPAGPAPANPTQVIDMLSRREVLQPWLDRYDVVVFDTPPASTFPDALLLARSCHELIFVIGYKMSSAQSAHRTLTRFAESGIARLGVILNRLPESKIINYGEYSGYGSQDTRFYKAYSSDRDDRSA